MSEMLALIRSPWSFVMLLLVFAMIPALLTRVVIIMYPKNHPRRREILGELAVVPRWEKPFWVSELLVAGITEGLSARRTDRRTKRAERGTRAVLIQRHGRHRAPGRYNPLDELKTLTRESLRLDRASD